MVAALAGAGIAVDVKTVAPLERDDRFACPLPGDRMAWFPQSEAGLARLGREARVLKLLAAHCDFRAPVVDYEATAGWQIRLSVPGHVDPFARYNRAVADPQFAATVGTAIGAILASQHAIPADALTGWLPTTPSWPPPRAEIERNLVSVSDDTGLIGRALQMIERHEHEAAQVADRVLVHCDLGFHNMVVDEAGAVVGVFDYDDAAFADRHLDFRYLLLDRQDEVLLQCAIAAYEAAGGKPIDMDRVRMLNAASAVGFLAFRAGHGPDERPAGRTLAEDLHWTRMALERAGG